MYDLEVLKRSETDRRAFLTRMTAAGLGAAAVALLAGCGGDSGSNNGNSTPDLQTTRTAFSFTPSGGALTTVPGANQNTIVLNYALSLEYLEADLYRQALNAASGRPLTTALDGTTPTGNQTAPVSSVAPSGNSSGSYSLGTSILPGTVSSNYQQAAFLYLVQFAYVEASHRDFLAAALGSSASPLQGPTKTYNFPTGTDTTSLSGILNAILPLEETGVRAYLGAGKYLQDNNTVQTAVAIYSTECRHSASIEYILDPTGNTVGPRKGITGVPSGEVEVDPTVAVAANVFEKALAPSLVLAGIFPLLA